MRLLPCVDSPQLSAAVEQKLNIPRRIAAELGRSAVEIARTGHYVNPAGNKVDISRLVADAGAAKRSIAPDAPLPTPQRARSSETHVQVRNETTFEAASRFVANGMRPLALNFANGIQAGGGFLHGARAQEEVLCRSSALYPTLLGDAMYLAHAQRPRPDSTPWAIYSPDVPVFRNDDGTPLDRPWLLSIITCAAPYAPALGQPEAGDLLQQRIHRVLSIAAAYAHPALVLGGWGCGAFGNDPQRTAADFRKALEGEFANTFCDVVFAIADWSPERRFLGPFRDAFR